MTEKIQQKIDQITKKVSALQHNLAIQVDKSERLSSEIDSLKATIGALEEEIQAKESELISLSEKMMVTTEQNATSSTDFNPQRDNEIDDLVKEIEYCIGQLKK
ncbi:MAG: hypothetical protein KJ941_00335 [Bacteroidetes bacterium]|nr:hypothetical protein [Bacteroidota bacterium]